MANNINTTIICMSYKLKLKYENKYLCRVLSGKIILRKKSNYWNLAQVKHNVNIGNGGSVLTNGGIQ